MRTALKCPCLQMSTETFRLRRLNTMRLGPREGLNRALTYVMARTPSASDIDPFSTNARGSFNAQNDIRRPVLAFPCPGSSSRSRAEYLCRQGWQHRRAETDL